MSKIRAPPKRKKRFNVKVIKFVCGDCNAVMERWSNPYTSTEEHFYVKCPVCGMHIRAYEKSFHCIAENGRPYLEIKWDKPLEWKKDFLQKEKNYYETKKRQQEDYDAFNKSLEEEYENDMKEIQEAGEET